MAEQPTEHHPLYLVRDGEVVGRVPEASEEQVAGALRAAADRERVLVRAVEPVVVRGQLTEEAREIWDDAVARAALPPTEGEADG